MTLFKDKFKIDSKRLKNWNYFSAAIYFITMVTQNRECLFGSIEEDKMILNENGQIVENELSKSIKIRKNWFFYNWIVMPNHIHVLIEIQEPRFVERQTENTKIDNVKNSETKIAHMHIVEAYSSASTSSISTTNDNKNVVQIVAETNSSAPLQNYHENKMESQLSRKPNSISSFVAIFKLVTTKQINGSVPIWQSNYHDHIVRNYKKFETIYNYIKANPRSWETDSMNSNFQ